MKKKETIINIAIVIVVILIIVIVKVKFFSGGNPQAGYIQDMEKMTVLDLKGNAVKFTSLLSGDDETFVLILTVYDCHTCILKGHEQLKSLKKEGKQAIGLVVSDDVPDIALWAQNYESAAFYVIKKVDFYTHIRAQQLPVMFTIEDKKVTGSKAITTEP